MDRRFAPFQQFVRLLFLNVWDSP